MTVGYVSMFIRVVVVSQIGEIMQDS